MGRRQIIFAINGADSLEFTSSSTLSWQRRPNTITSTQKFRDTTNWYHILCKSESGAFYLYVNNVLVASNTSSSANPYTAGDIHIGSNSPNGSLNSSTSFDGYMADFHWVQGTALGSDSFGETGAYGEWKPKEYTGGHGSNGFYLSFTTAGNKHALSGSGNTAHSTSQQKFGASSIYFDGSSDKLTADSNHADFAFGTGDFTLEAWIRWDAQGQNKTLIGNRQGAVNDAWMFYISTSYELAFSSGTAILCRGGSAVPATTWVHVAAVRQNGTMRLYKGGVQMQSAGGVTNNFSSTNKIFLCAGDTQGNSDFAGYMDDIRVSNVCRYPDGTTFTPHTTSHEDDDNTILLIKSDTTNGSTTFTDSSGGVTGLGTDMSANSNNFTLGSGSMNTHDHMLDSPTNNFCTWHPEHKDAENNTNNYLEGNLQLGGGGGASWRETFASFEVPKTGKWYMEFLHLGGYAHIGLMSSPYAVNSGDSVQTGHAWWDYDTQQGSGAINYNNTGQTSGGTGSGLVFAISVNEGVVKFYKSNSVVNTFSQNLSNAGEHPVHPIVQTYSSAEWFANFGQSHLFGGAKSDGANASDANGYGSFYYAPPTDHLALCSKNLPDPTITPSKNFNTVLYTGDGGSDRTITTNLSAVDLVWVKLRSGSDDHRIADTVRGGNKHLKSNDHSAESTGTTIIKSFSGATFNVGSDGSVNGNGSTYVAWTWKANGSGSANTTGTINSTVSANTSAGFSIVSYTGNGSNGATVGHGLSQAPNLVIVKNRTDGGNSWLTGSIQNIAGTTMDFTDYLRIDAGDALGDEHTLWNDTAPTSSVVTLGTHGWSNTNTKNYIMYCFHNVAGYSKIGSYYGNGSTDGTFVYMGFKPAWIMIKNMVTNGSSWLVTDNKMNPTNDGAMSNLWAEHTSAANENDYEYDFLSNGLKLRATSSNINNTSQFLYIAFAEQPFKYSNAR